MPAMKESTVWESTEKVSEDMTLECRRKSESAEELGARQFTEQRKKWV